MIAWKDEFMIGHQDIDQQHQKLFAIANEIFALLKNDVILDKYDRISELVSQLTDYTVYHFKFEENLMESMGYKKLISHKVEHDKFILKIKSIDFDSIDEDQDGHLMELLNFVVDWIKNHIMSRDMLIMN